MSFVAKVAVATALAAAALWAPAAVPAAPPPSAPAAWADGAALARRVADTLSTEAALGQLVAARADAHGLDAMVRRGQVGRVVVAGGDAEAHLARLRAWQAAAPLPVMFSTAPGETGALPFEAAPAAASAAMLGAAGRPDLAFLTGKALAEAASGLGVQSPGTALALGAGASPFGPIPGGPVEQALARGLRDGGVLPAAQILDDSGLAALDALADAGLMEVRLAVSTGDDVERIRQVKARGAFGGLVQAEVDAQAVGAVDAVRAGADGVLSDAPAVVLDSLRAAVASGRLDRARVHASAVRVLSAKAWSGLALAPRPRRSGAGDGDAGPAVRIEPGRAPSAALRHRAGLLRGEVSRRAVTVLQGDGGPLPAVARAVPPSTFVVLLDPGADGDAGLVFANTLATGLAPAGRAGYARLGLGLDAGRYDDARAAAAAADLVVLAALPDADGRLAARHRAFVQELGRERPTVVVALGPPALAAGLERPDALVVAYDDSPDAQRAAAFALTGQTDVSGRLPWGVAGLAASGDGVRLRQQALRPGAPEEAGLDAETADRVDAVMERAVRSGAFPGAAVAVGRDGVLVRLRGYGRLTRGGAGVTPETPYDLASLTKVVGTTAAAMRLVEDGRLDLDATVTSYLPRYRSLGKDRVTVRQLLSHSAGHRAWYPFWSHGVATRDGVLDFIYADTLQYRPGARSRYSDFDMILLGEVVERVTGRPLADVFQDQVFGPLGMAQTGFRAVGAVDRAVAPTEADRAFRGRTLQGEVHDEAASVMGGVAGHAGLFSTASDLARFAFVLADGGAGYGTRLFRRTTLDQFVRPVRLESTYPTGLGWMVNAGRGNSAAGSQFGPRSFGHTGYTGTSIWVDPDQGLFVVLLSNRVHPSRANRRIRDVRPALADAVAGAVTAPPGRPERGWGFGPLPDDLPPVARR